VKTVASDKSVLFQEAFAQGKADEAAWARWGSQRQSALEILVAGGTQTRGREEWLFGDAGAMAAGDTLPVSGALVRDDSISDFASIIATENSHLLVFVNGIYDASRSRIGKIGRASCRERV